MPPPPSLIIVRPVVVLATVIPPSRRTRLMAMFPIVFASAPLGRTALKLICICLVVPSVVIALESDPTLFPNLAPPLRTLVSLRKVVVARLRMVLDLRTVVWHLGSLTRCWPSLRETTLNLRRRVTLASILPL